MEKSNEDVKNDSWKILKNSVMRLSIDREFLLTDRMLISIDRMEIENQLNEAKA